MEEESLIFRLKNILSSLGINSSTFADKCGIARATLSQLMTGRNKKISAHIVTQIHDAYPDINILWLLFGEGSMFITEGDKRNLNSEVIGNTDQAETSSDQVQSDSLRAGNGYENLKLPITGQQEKNNSKENGFKSTSEIYQLQEKQINNIKKIESELSQQIEELRKQIRKVDHITIYYDDNTFETLYPGK